MQAFRTISLLCASALALGGIPGVAQAPENLVPGAPPVPVAAPAPQPAPLDLPSPLDPSQQFVSEPVMHWDVADAGALLGVIRSIASEGLFPSDYQPDALEAAIAAGEGDALDAQASRSFDWLAEDLRDGRTPVAARVQWFAIDPDQDRDPTEALLARALESHDVAGVLAGLSPTHPDYLALKKALAETLPEDEARRELIQVNMDRWRWLPRDLGEIYLLTNVPEFQLRLMKGPRIVRTYKTIVGKPGRTATPQLSEMVEAVVFNPTWTVPQSIVKGEGLGAQLLADPAKAARENYKVTKAADGTITVVQQPGKGNSLGVMKIDMPNPHAIYLHDTPSKSLFNAEVRAFSHGCIRTENALSLGMTMAILGAGLGQDDVAQLSSAGKYKRVTMTRTFPVYLAYFTMGQDVNGQLRAFKDLYERDAPVLASFALPRQPKTMQRSSEEEVIQLDNPL